MIFNLITFIKTWHLYPPLQGLAFKKSFKCITGGIVLTISSALKDFSHCVVFSTDNSAWPGNDINKQSRQNNKILLGFNQNTVNFGIILCRHLVYWSAPEVWSLVFQIWVTTQGLNLDLGELGDKLNNLKIAKNCEIHKVKERTAIYMFIYLLLKYLTSNLTSLFTPPTKSWLMKYNPYSSSWGTFENVLTNINKDINELTL